MRRPLWISLATLVVAAAALLATSSCATRFPRRSPVGETFPSVIATSLEGDAVQVPGDFAGEPLLLLAAYDQDAQFDVDRWLLGLLQAQLDVTIRELPTIPGFVPGLFEGTINEGMRGGIPSEDWGLVLTVYDDGEKVARFTGSEGDNNTRVLLLDGAGKVVYYHDSGYSARVVLEIEAALEALKSGTPALEPAAGR